MSQLTMRPQEARAEQPVRKLSSRQFLAVYAILLIILCLITKFRGLSPFVLLLLVPAAIVAGVTYSRAVYLSTLGLLAGASLWAFHIRGHDLNVGVLATVLVMAISVFHAEWLSRWARRRRHLAAELAAERDFVRSVVQTAHSIILMLDHRGAITWYNQAAADLLGAGLEEVRGEEWVTRFVPADDRGGVRERILQTIAGDPTHGFVNPIIAHEGLRQILWYAQPLPERDGVAEGLFAIGYDVTEQVAAEAALRESEALYRSLVEHLGEGICMVSTEDERILFANPAAHATFGVPSGSLVGGTLADYTDPATFERLRSQTERRLRGLTDSYEIDIRRPDGEPRTLLVTAVPQTNDDGVVPATLAIFRDITGRKAGEAALQRRATELDLINRVGREIAGELEWEALRERAVTLIRDAFGYDHVGLLTVDHDRREIRMVAWSDAFDVSFPPDYTLSLDQGLLGWACRHGEAVLVNDVAQDDRYVNRYADHLPTQAELCVPIWVGDDVVAILDVQSAHKDAFDAQDLMVMQTLAAQLAVAISNARTYAALQKELEERLRAETALRDSQERLNLALEGGELSLWSWRRGEDIALDAVSRITSLGYAAPEGPTGYRAYLALVHPEDRRRFHDAVRTYSNATGDRPFVTEHRLRAQDGTWRWMLVRGRVVRRDASGEPLRIAGTFLDITARKQAELALQEANATLEATVTARTAELQAERDRSAAILRTTGDAIAHVDRDLHVSYVNPAFERVTGYTADEVLDHDIRELVKAYNDPEITRRMRTILAEAETWNGELVLERKGGQPYDALVHIAPVWDGGETPAGYLTSHRDISALKRLQRIQTRFISNVSHELRTPIAVLKLYTDLLPTATAEKRPAYERALQTEIERLTRTVNNILRINSLGAEGAHLDRRPVPLNTFIREEVLPKGESLHGEGAPRITTRLTEADPDITLNRSWLAEAVLHLIENARHATPADGEITLSTDLHTTPHGQWATIAVTDTGVGIPEEERSRVFDRFFRGKQREEDQSPGAGLGLSIVRAIVELHGGHVTVDSEVGVGSTFTLWLPIGEHVVVNYPSSPIPQGVPYDTT